jgi:hypothetical protein
MRKLPLVFLLSAFVSGMRLNAVPPLVSGDVPTAEKNGFELYTGFLYESDAGSISRAIPCLELNYGISDRQEITFEIPYLSTDGKNGFGDATIGTKYVMLQETKKLPGIAGSFELKLRNGSFSRGLGSGAVNYDFRLRTEKAWGSFTTMANLGYTIVGEPHFDGTTDSRKNVWFASFVQEYKVTSKTNLLGEIYLETSDEPGQPNRFAANVGFEQEIVRDLTFQAAVGRSLREGTSGGPDLRAYVGLHWVFDAPWKPKEKEATGKQK